MATPVQPVSTLNIDGTAFNVSDLSDKVQALVGIYNDWNQDLVNAQTKFAQLQAALNDLSRQIILQVKADQDAAAAAAAANDSSVVADAAPVAADGTAKE
jgi:hypothetical protein